MLKSTYQSDAYKILAFYETFAAHQKSGFSPFVDNREFYFAYYVDKKIVLLSQSYKSESERDAAIASVKSNLNSVDRLEILILNSREYRVRLNNQENEEIAISPAYATHVDAVLGIKALEGYGVPIEEEADVVKANEVDEFVDTVKKTPELKQEKFDESVSEPVQKTVVARNQETVKVLVAWPAPIAADHPILAKKPQIPPKVKPVVLTPPPSASLDTPMSIQKDIEPIGLAPRAPIAAKKPIIAMTAARVPQDAPLQSEAIEFVVPTRAPRQIGLPRFEFTLNPRWMIGIVPLALILGLTGLSVESLRSERLFTEIQKPEPEVSKASEVEGVSPLIHDIGQAAKDETESRQPAIMIDPKIGQSVEHEDIAEDEKNVDLMNSISALAENSGANLEMATLSPTEEPLPENPVISKPLGEKPEHVDSQTANDLLYKVLLEASRAETLKNKDVADQTMTTPISKHKDLDPQTKLSQTLEAQIPEVRVQVPQTTGPKTQLPQTIISKTPVIHAPLTESSVGGKNNLQIESSPKNSSDIISSASLDPVNSMAEGISPIPELSINACGYSENPMFSVPADVIPVDVIRLGTFPEFGNSHHLSPAQFYEKLRALYEATQFEQQYLDHVFRSMGYEDGFKAATPDMFTNVTLAQGAKGVLGQGVLHDLQISELNVRTAEDLEAFNIRSKNGRNVNYMKTCGNYMHVCQ